MKPTESYIDFKITYGEMRGVRYTSGSLVFDEQLADGRLIARFWSANGQIIPEMHLNASKLLADCGSFQMNSFRLGVGGREVSDGWKWLSAGTCADTTGLRDITGAARVVAVRLAHDTLPLQVAVHTRLDGTAMMVRWLDIMNTGDSVLALSSVYPMAGRIWHHAPGPHEAYSMCETLDSEAECPLRIAYDHDREWVREGDFYFEPVRPGTFRFSSRNGRSGHARPAFWLRNRLNGETFVCEFAWSGNWDMEVEHDNRNQLMQAGFAMGMGPLEGEMLRVLEPGETVSTPLVHAGLFHCGNDDITNALHEHIRTVVLPEAPPGRVCEIEANHRGYLCDRENEAGLKADADVAAAIGAEMYIVDAGWFGHEPNQWRENVGDWFAGDWLPNGLETVAGHVHALGMKFGLWVEVEAAGKNSSLRKDHPEWLFMRNGQPVAGGRALNCADPEVIAWIKREITRMIRQYRLDMFRIDNNHLLELGGNRVCAGYTENLLWRYYENLYSLFDAVRADFPNVVFQNCAGGGGRLDLGMLQRFHNTEISDWMRKPRDLKIFNNLTMSVPPEIMLRAFGTESAEIVMEGDLNTQLRDVIMGCPIFRGIAPSLEELNPHLKECIRHQLKNFNDFIRPISGTCRVFHHTPMLPIGESAPWVVLEYASSDRTRSVISFLKQMTRTVRIP